SCPPSLHQQGPGLGCRGDEEEKEGQDTGYISVGQPDSLECSLAGQTCLVTFNQFPREACLALSSAFYKVPQSHTVHKQ
ncbi:hypothetical protein KUCAC02_017089, partial [Chaenocephalus aceratus]